MSRGKKNKDIEAIFKRLEEIVKDLEDGNIPLDQALKEFEEGVAIVREAAEVLEEAEKKVELLIKDKEGILKREPFRSFTDLDEEE